MDLLVSRGLAATTTAEVQRAAGISRGALLHHFPTRDALFGATIRHLMQRKEATVREALGGQGHQAEPVERAIRALSSAVLRPAFAAELELWAAARTNEALREVLRREEKRARGDLYRVVDDVFGTELTAHPRYPRIASLTVQFLRGLAISDVLRGESRATEQLLRDWAAVVRAAMASPPPDDPTAERR